MTKDEFNEKYIRNGKFVPCESNDRRHARHPEHDLQVQCVRYFRVKYPWLIIYANPNGGYRTKTEAKRLVEEGVVSGIPDLFVPFARNGYNGLYIEMKNGDKGVVSENQEKIMRKLIQLGYKCDVVRTIDQFTELVDDYIGQL